MLAKDEHFEPKIIADNYSINNNLMCVMCFTEQY